jgi:hypothetical protein
MTGGAAARAARLKAAGAGHPAGAAVGAAKRPAKEAAPGAGPRIGTGRAGMPAKPCRGART